MECSLSQDSINVLLRAVDELSLVISTPKWQDTLSKSSPLGWVWLCMTSNFGGHNSFVRTPLQVFLDFMESPLSQDSIHIPVVNIGCQAKLGQVGSARQVSSAPMNLTTCDLQLW